MIYIPGVEQPEGDEEHQHQEADQGAEDEDPGKRRLGLPEEHGPRADEEDEEFESKTDEHSVTSHITVEVESSRVRVKHSQLGQDHHEDGTEESGDGECRGGEGPEILLTPLVQTPPGLYLPLAEVLLHCVLNVRGVRHSRRGLPPVLILTLENIRNLDQSHAIKTGSAFCILFLEYKAAQLTNSQDRTHYNPFCLMMWS